MHMHDDLRRVSGAKVNLEDKLFEEFLESHRKCSAEKKLDAYEILTCSKKPGHDGPHYWTEWDVEW